MKVAIYIRVSMEETNSNSRQYQDPKNQLQPLRDFCKAMNYEIVEVYEDRMSGANPARPAFRKMLQDAMLRRFSGILVWKLDRFSREGIMPTMSYIQKLKSRGIWLRSLTESWLDTSQEGITEMVLAIMSWASAEERKKISERTKAGIARKKALGKWKGGRPRINKDKIGEVCVAKEDGLYCRVCDKRFKDYDTWSRVWNAHTYSARHREELKGGKNNAKG